MFLFVRFENFSKKSHGSGSVSIEGSGPCHKLKLQHLISLNEKFSSATGNLMITNNCGSVLNAGDKNPYSWPFNEISFLTSSIDVL